VALHQGISDGISYFAVRMNNSRQKPEIRQLAVVFDGEEVVFACLTAEPKGLREFIGGYVFLALRGRRMRGRRMRGPRGRGPLYEADREALDPSSCFERVFGNLIVHGAYCVGNIRFHINLKISFQKC
jgi:hypothetical protein